MNINFKIYDWPLYARSIIIGVVCLIVFYFGYLFDVTSLDAQLNQISQKEIDFKSQLISISRKQSEVANELLQYDVLVAELNKVQKKLITSEELPELLNDILKIGTQNQLVFTSFDPEAQVIEGIYIKVPIKIVAAGTYDQMATFISQVANLDKVVVIDNFNITLSSQVTNELTADKLTPLGIGLLKAEITLQVYEEKKVENK